MEKETIRPLCSFSLHHCVFSIHKWDDQKTQVFSQYWEVILSELTWGSHEKDPKRRSKCSRVQDRTFTPLKEGGWNSRSGNSIHSQIKSILKVSMENIYVKWVALSDQKLGNISQVKEVAHDDFSIDSVLIRVVTTEQSETYFFSICICCRGILFRFLMTW